MQLNVSEYHLRILLRNNDRDVQDIRGFDQSCSLLHDDREMYNGRSESLLHVANKERAFRGDQFAKFGHF